MHSQQVDPHDSLEEIINSPTANWAYLDNIYETFDRGKRGNHSTYSFMDRSEISFLDSLRSGPHSERKSFISLLGNCSINFLKLFFCHHYALTAGIDSASMVAPILMDGDLQDTPETLPQFIKKMGRGL